MKSKFVLDACAIIAFLADENGAEKVQDLLNLSKWKILFYTFTRLI